MGLTLEVLKKDHGMSVTAPTLYAWIEKYTWKDRAARAEAEEQRVKDVGLGFEDKMMASLIEQKESYEKYFKTLGHSPDNQATYAYTNLIKTIIDIKRKLKAEQAAEDIEQITKSKGLTDETVEEIRKKILGIAA